MNKKIKVIDLLNKIANKEEVPKKIKWQDNIYEYDFEDDLGYASARMDFGVRQYLTDDLSLDTFKDLNDEVEILEENTEKIEELTRYEDMEEYDYRDIDINRDKINELVKAVNNLRKEKSK